MLKERSEAAVARANAAVIAEMREVMGKFQPYNSLHEAYGILAEEVAEVFDEVRRKETARDDKHMRHELIQVAAVATLAAAQLDSGR